MTLIEKFKEAQAIADRNSLRLYGSNRYAVNICQVTNRSPEMLAAIGALAAAAIVKWEYPWRWSDD